MKIKTIKEICANIAQNNELVLENNQNITFGFAKLDNLLGDKYLKEGNVICLSAKPGIGKTTLALDFILTVAKTSNKEIIYLTSQQNYDHIINKLIQKISGLNMQNKIISENEQDILFNTLQDLYNLKITILNFIGGILERIEEMLETKRDISLIVIDDYNDLISYEKNALIKIKVLSKCFNIPILLCGILINNPNKIKNQKPNLNDLAKQEKYFDIVLFLHRDTYYLEFGDNHNPNLSELIIAKNNSGNTGEIDLYFDFKKQKFL